MLSCTLSEHCQKKSVEITKNRALAQASFRRQIILNQSQRKARAKYGICAGFWFGSSWAQSQAVGRSIYWGEPQRAPQLRVDLDFRHSRYIYIYKSSVRPLGFVPATIEPKSRASPVLRPCFPLALIDDYFFSSGSLHKSPVQRLCFFTHFGCSGAL